MIGLEFAEGSIEAYNKMKMKRAYRWIVYKIEEEKCVVIDKIGDPSATYADFFAAIPEAEPRYNISR